MPNESAQPTRRRAWWWKKSNKPAEEISDTELEGEQPMLILLASQDAASSLQAHRPRSERSSAMSVVESTASIWSKPWVSQTHEEGQLDRPLVASVSEPTLPQQRSSGSSVWPGKLKAGFGRLVGRSQSDDKETKDPSQDIL
ncbi:hypothetical protein PHYBLDRAFT_179674 [Phycomyces blakesleeanus NRRL 1555(-)]|uniref:Uncharacterized protein n=1 Tax=Phycomyces blakesleeanus (strain ATCC 8743b / DSM 1359 / FGSC 10004 / NBRC 33097 / NRRL 1555) TaxID=763407 RepID=A0A167PXS4_PHYB8|nr:hypothetical protein PHYBLDRAFT_179674 [Phycomyces blakesleeanus NRRL 1555(-)]OAD78736.1 hypothetical protein PHYBLDRAFT_179674 [Phycomyces blakesleeanus NRRL 1555(-)]|eukprot:XP_018296776.1 hypothetical protein PHYBLDRAFT_179674 [Phycomyces blakesleeanus NRRL 1555(-)]